MLRVIDIENSIEWDKIVKNFKTYDVYYLSGYVKPFMVHGDGRPQLFYYKDKHIEAINVVMLRDIAEHPNFKDKLEKNTYYDLITPYGYGGFLIEGEKNSKNLKNLKSAYEEYCIDHNIVSEFIRFNPLTKNVEDSQNIYETVELGKTVTIDLDGKHSEELWNSLLGKNRNTIRKAKKNNVEIFWSNDRVLIDSFMPMYNHTMDKDNATNYYYFKKEFYDSLQENLKYNYLYFYAVYNNEIIAMAMIIFDNKKMHYHLSASKKEFQYLSATNLLLFEAAVWGINNGFKEFHLGGGLGSKEDSLYKFKSAFNKKSVTTFSIGKKIFQSEIYNELKDFNKSNGQRKSLGFPIYRYN